MQPFGYSQAHEPHCGGRTPDTTQHVSVAEREVHRLRIAHARGTLEAVL